MRPCPSCGAPRADAGRCPACGGAAAGDDPDGATLVDPEPLGALVGAREALLRTKVLGTPRAEASPSDPPPGARTLVGVPKLDPAGGVAARSPSPAAPASPGSGAKTLPMGAGLGARRGPSPPPRAAEERPAPRAPSALENSASTGPHELGETLLPDMAWQARRLGKPVLPEPLAKRRKLAAAPPKKRAEATTWLLLAGAALALFAVVLASLWGRAEAVTGRVVADPEGRPLLVVTCARCAEGTRLVVSGVEAPFVGQSAALRLAADPPVGTLRVPVAIVSGESRDELALEAAVPYRLHVDLGTLAGERPIIALSGEVAEGVTLEIAGAPAVSLGEGRVSGSFDASDACALPGDGPMIAEIPYVVSERGKEPEPATLRVVAERAPLHLDAPGRRVVLEGPSFELAGSTTPGATLSVAGRPIAVRPTGVFRQTMNVSSTGKTQIEARATLPGLAPRIVRIAVERVLSLDAAAASFRPTVTAKAMREDPLAATGGAVAFEGTVTSLEPNGARVVVTLELGAAAGCAAGESCPVRVLAFTPLGDAQGKTLGVYGTVRGRGADGLPEVEADFTTRPR